ncbi:hypothetical protein ASF62_16670 [Leifsonia sp. Leaf325]|nr:hypothetical protein ASF62_16670 [Leifsonia sp. Leaf325]
MMATDAGTRRRSRADTARAIEGAAIELVLAHGYADVTVDMICDAASVSQRTFFNYFKTKDAALLGNALPEIDVERARVFADSTGPLLVEAIGLIRVDTEFVFDDEKLFADRIRAISSHPELLARQMERLAGIETELRQLIGARLERQHPQLDAADRALQIDFITNIVAGAMRFLGQAIARSIESGESPLDQVQLGRLIADVLPRLG